ncbi:hypothetical protein ACFLZ2_02110 [Candidatus Margulisiibacteriota bacterium]
MKLIPHKKIILIILLLAAICHGNVLAEEKTPAIFWKDGGIAINDSQGKSIRQNAKITSCNDNTFVIVWEDTRNGYLDIYAQKMDRYGNILWGNDGIPVCTAQKNQSFPEVTCIDGDEVVITWQDYRGNYSDIYAQKLNRSGTSKWKKDGVPVCKASVNQLAPRLIPDGQGGVVVTWYDYRSGMGEDIYAQKLGTSGDIKWLENGIPICTSEGTQWYPKIISDGIADGNGGVIIVWDDKRSSVYDIYVQRINNDGKSIWQNNGLPICTAPENQEFAEIAINSNGFVVTWQDYRNGNADVYAQKIDLLGKLLWKKNGIPICNILGGQEKPKIIGGKNDVIITWEDYRSGPANSDIYAQKVADDGELLWGKYGTAMCERKEKQEDPNLISDGAGGAIIYWKDLRNSKPSIYARRINEKGQALWVSGGWPVCKSFDAEYAEVARLGDVFTFVWQDRRGGSLDVYTQSIDLSGNCLWQVHGINVNTNFGSVTQQKPRIVDAGNKEYIIVWEDYRNGFSNIYIQKTNNNGELLWDRDGVRLCGFSSNQVNPRIVADNNGEAIIVWQDHRDKNPNIYAQKISSKGALAWYENGIPIASFKSNQLNPEIVKDGEGGAIISWLDDRNKDNGLDVYAQKLDTSGSVKWKNVGVTVCDSPGLQTEQKNAEDEEGGVIITWTDFRRSLKNPDIYAQRLSKTGETIWRANGAPICKAPDTQRNAELTGLKSVIVAWEDSGSGNYDIYAQKINADSSVNWTVDGIEVCAAKYTQHDPKLARDHKGGAIIVWEDYRNTNWDIYAQRLDNNGTRLWNVSGIPVSTAKSTQYSPQLIVNKDGSSIIVWEDYRNGKNYNIYATQLNTLGKYLWDDQGIRVSKSIDGARDPQIVSDGENGAIVVWTDFRFGNYDIYAQRIKGKD